MRRIALIIIALSMGACDEPDGVDAVEFRYYKEAEAAFLAKVVDGCLDDDPAVLDINFNIDGPPSILTGSQPWTLVVFGHSHKTRAACMANALKE